MPSLRLLSLRELVAVAVVVGALAAAYAAARFTPLFAVRSIEVVGAPPSVVRDVRAALDGLVGRSLVSVDGAALERRLGELPSVRSVVVDRAFPHALVAVVDAERPVALVGGGRRAWLLGEGGSVIRELGADERPRLPEIRLSRNAPLEPRRFARDPGLALAVTALLAVPDDFPARVVAARVRGRTIALVLAGRTELRLGTPSSLRAKMDAAEAVLRALPRDERGALTYLDVSLPTRPVARLNAQP